MGCVAMQMCAPHSAHYYALRVTLCRSGRAGTAAEGEWELVPPSSGRTDGGGPRMSSSGGAPLTAMQIILQEMSANTSKHA